MAVNKKEIGRRIKKIRVNYLVGKNNSGKSSFLQAVLLTCLYRNEDGSRFLNSSFPENLAAYREYYSDEDISSPIKVRPHPLQTD